MKENDKTIYLAWVIPIVWFGLLIAPYIDGGIINVIENLTQITSNPFNIEICKNSVKTVLFLLFCLRRILKFSAIINLCSFLFIVLPPTIT